MASVTGIDYVDTSGIPGAQPIRQNNLAAMMNDVQSRISKVENASLGLSPMPMPSGDATADMLNLRKALSGGGIPTAQQGDYLLDDLLVVGQGCGLLGQGANGLADDGGTKFICTTPQAGIMVDDAGGIVGNFNVDGNGIAEKPFQVGKTAESFGAARLFSHIIVGNALFDNWTVKYIQNSVFNMCMSYQAGRDSIVFDGGCGALTFIGWNTEWCGRYGIYSQALDVPDPSISLYQVPTRIMFYGGLTEHSTLSPWQNDMGYGFLFDNHDLSGPSPCASIATIGTGTDPYGRTWTRSLGHVLRDIGYSGNSALALSIDGNSSAELDGGIIYTSFQGIHLAAGAVLKLGARPDNYGFDASTPISAINAIIPPGGGDLAWTNAILQNGWTNFAGTAARYRKNGQRWVSVQGLIQSGTTTGGTVLLALPPGYRPGQNLRFPLTNQNNYGECIVTTAGNVQFNFAANNNVALSLDSISFFAEG